MTTSFEDRGYPRGAPLWLALLLLPVAEGIAWTLSSQPFFYWPLWPVHGIVLAAAVCLLVDFCALVAWQRRLLAVHHSNDDENNIRANDWRETELELCGNDAFELGHVGNPHQLAEISVRHARNAAGAQDARWISLYIVGAFLASISGYLMFCRSVSVESASGTFSGLLPILLISQGEFVGLVAATVLVSLFNRRIWRLREEEFIKFLAQRHQAEELQRPTSGPTAPEEVQFPATGIVQGSVAKSATGLPPVSGPFGGLPPDPFELRPGTKPPDRPRSPSPVPRVSNSDDVEEFN